ncbi:TetR/AcrR family transcriptional regulator [Leptospira ryugenii]|nr:TetR/AcrR family transcriptional regulator [Leptospira ryugenii]
MKAKQPLQAKPMDKDLAILRSALALFAEKGYEATTMPEIAKLANVASGTLYLYFKNKEELVNALWKKEKLELKERLWNSLDPNANYESQLKSLYASYLKFAIDAPTSFQFLSLHYHFPYLSKENTKIDQEIEEFLFQFLKEGQKKKWVVDVPPALLLAILDGGVVGIFKAIQKGSLQANAKNFQSAVAQAWDLIRKK